MTITAPHPRPADPTPVRKDGRSVGRVVALVLGVSLLLGAAGSLATAGVLTWFDNDRRDGDYLTTDKTALSTDSHSLAIEEIDLNGLDGDWVLGRTRLRATAGDPDTSVFIGVARTEDAEDYLRDVAYTTVSDIDDQEAEYDDHSGDAPSTTPEAADIWVAQASGPGTQTLTWTPRDGNWTAIIMNADASAGVDVSTDIGATVPVFEWVLCGLWALGAGLAAAGGLLVTGALFLRKRT